MTPATVELIERLENIAVRSAAPAIEPVVSVGYQFAKASQPLVGVIDTGFAGNNPDMVNPRSSAAKGFDRADYYSYGRGLDILANGGTTESGILSTVGDGVGTMAGISVAAAKVIGAASQGKGGESGVEQPAGD